MLHYPKIRSKTFITAIKPLVLAAGLFLSANTAHAAGSLSVEIVSPMPNAMYVYGTPILFEAAVKDGIQYGDTVTLQWDLKNDGTDISVPITITTATGSYANYSMDLQPDGSHLSGYDKFRYAVAPSDPKYSYSANTSYTVKLNVTSSRGGSATATATFSLYDSYDFTGYVYVGASTGICVSPATHQPGSPAVTCNTDSECTGGEVCGGDAPGFAAFSCTLQQVVPCTVPYRVQFGKVASSSANASLENHAWFGESESDIPNDPNPSVTGWMTFNKQRCTAGDPAKSDLSCSSNADCGSAGICSTISASIPSSIDPEAWSDASSNEMNLTYSSPTIFSSQTRFPGAVVGWGRIQSLADYGKTLNPPQNDAGWVHLRGEKVTTGLSGATYNQCQDCSGGGSDTTRTKCNVCNQATLSGGGTQNYACNSCYTCTSSGGSVSCDSCEQCNQYGVSFDSQNGELVGYGWSGGSNETSSIPGYGWIKFSPPAGVSILQGWLSTRYGDVYSSLGSIVSRTQPPAGSYNATFIVQANGTVNFSTPSILSSDIRQNYPNQVLLPSSSAKYVNVLGRINFPELIGDGTQPLFPKENRYGITQWITKLEDIPHEAIDPANKILKLKPAGGIYYLQGNLDIPDSDYTSVEIEAGTGTLAVGDLTSGAGTIIVDGDVNLKANMQYQSSAVSDTAQIPSLGWIIRGDTIVDPAVENLVGSFLVLGCPGGSAPCGTSARDGMVKTGYSLTTPLTVNGLIMAKRFSFERNVLSSHGVLGGSERINYDGRFLANPPPGLQDLSAAVPSLRLDIPQ